MKIDQMPDPREERELAESLHQALEPLQDAPPPSLAPEQIAAMLEAEAKPSASIRKSLPRWLPLLVGCAAALLLLFPFSHFLPRSKNAGDLPLSNELTSNRGEIFSQICESGKTDNDSFDAAVTSKASGSVQDTSQNPQAPPSNSQQPVGDPSRPAAESEVLTIPQKVTAAEALVLLKSDILLVDVRSAEDFSGGHIKGAINIPLEFLPERIDSFLPAGERVIVCCSVGECSAQAAALLTSLGYQAYDLGSVDAWPFEKIGGETAAP